MTKLLKFVKYIWVYTCKPASPSLLASSSIRYNQPISYYWKKAMEAKCLSREPLITSVVTGLNERISEQAKGIIEET
ncbi:hypothetical protein ACSBRS_010710 [Streptococcus suis]|uniref:hypothetical protein n=1 Tax=Streptococcus suis TaxID=1307 RepID=UPI00129034A0|nr:hypothetical protein [Streptococcus suis]HEL1630269.1 hypothetical protein [Streptococcus suis]